MYLGVDLGTSSIKVLLANGKGEIIDSESTSYSISYPQKNWSEQNPEDWWKGFEKVVSNLGKRHNLKELEAISFSGQMHGLVILDENDNIIRPAILWNDGRTTDECDFLNNEIGKDNLISWTGNVALTGFTAPKVLWLKNNEPDNFHRIKKIMLPKDYLQYRLTGIFASDVSDDSGTLYFDVKNKCWSNEMLEILGIKQEQLPAVFESVDKIGKIKEDVAKKLNLSNQTITVMGGGDQAMGAIGTGTINSGQISISLGTSGVIFINSDEFVEDNEASLHSFCHANGKYHLMGVTLACAASTKWWVEDILKESDYSKVLKDIDNIPIDNTIFLPYMIGERSPINDPYAVGKFINLNLSLSQKSMTKAVIEGVCFSLRDCLNVAIKKGVTPKFARVIGGGAKSSEWLQILADILNIEVRKINTTEGGGLGAIILCMTAMGKFSNIEQSCNALIKETQSFFPRKKEVQEYNEKFKLYKKAYLM